MFRQLCTLITVLFAPLCLVAEETAPSIAQETTVQMTPAQSAEQREQEQSPPQHDMTMQEDNTSDVVPMGDPPHMSMQVQKQFFRTLVAIVIIILVALFVIWIIRRAGPSRIYHSNKQKNIKIIERRAISSQTYLYHVQVGDKQFIMSESKMEVRTLATLDWPES